MKNSILIIILLLFTDAIFAQDVFDKFDGKEGVKAIVVNKKMFQMMASVKVDTNDKDAQAYLELLKKLDNLKVFTTSDDKIGSDMKKTAANYSKSAGLEEMMRMNDEGQNMRIMVKSGVNETQVKELLMYSEEISKENETILMFLTGSFDLNDIYILTDKMKIPGAEDLKKASKNTN